MRVCAAAALVLVVAGCSVDDGETSQAVAPQLASGALVPTTCVPRTPRASATVAFVANGHAWALGPQSRRPTCLFSVRAPGPFAWGPRGDRALLARLEVKSFGDEPNRPASSAAPRATSWGRPIGKAIVFVGRGGRALLKAHPAGGGFTDVTPIPGARYERIVYHPSGLAFAFVLRDDDHESLWMSSNVGKDPRQLVHGRFHTNFEAIAFSVDGRVLYFAARHADSRVDVHRVALGGATEAPVEWRGGPHERVTEIVAGPAVGGALALTAGRSCGTRRAVVVTRARPDGVDVLPDAKGSRAVGWIDEQHILVAAGGCGRRLDVYSVSVSSLRARLLVKNVVAAAIRRAEPFPPPPLPGKGEEGGSGVA
jgi:hypothetical protein